MSDMEMEPKLFLTDEEYRLIVSSLDFRKRRMQITLERSDLTERQRSDISRVEVECWTLGSKMAKHRRTVLQNRKG